MISQEKRENGSRMGFEVRNIATGETGLLAHVNQIRGPRVGRYKVDLKGLNSVGVKAIIEAISISDIIVIDEIGPMELYSAFFKEAVLKAMGSGKPVLCTIHYRSKDPFIFRIRGLEDTEIIKVTRENRDRLPEDVSRRLLGYLKHARARK
jgi:nucleoside-triphosphatase